MLRLARKIADIFINISAVFGGAALFAGLAVILVDVVGRLFGAPLRGSPDLVQMAFVLMVFGGIPYCDRIGGNVAVDLLEDYFSPDLNRLFIILGNIIGAVVFALLAWQLWESSKLSNMLNLSTNILFLPKAPFQYAAVALCIITCISQALRVVELACGAPLPASDPVKTEA